MPPATLRLRSDEHLVSLFRAGREDAFETLHERHRRRLHADRRRALRGHGGDAEGIVQEAFLRAHRALREDPRPLELKPWLHRVVRNLCIDELRRNRLPTHRALPTATARARARTSTRRSAAATSCGG